RVGWGCVSGCGGLKGQTGLRLTLSRQQRLRAAAGEPAAGFADADRDYVKLPSIDCLENRSRRKQRDFMLAAAAAKENAYAQFFRHASLIVWVSRRSYVDTCDFQSRPIH